MSRLSPRLKTLVDQTVRLLGNVILEELGTPAFRRIEGIRREMALLRTASFERKQIVLRRNLRRLEALSPEERKEIAHAYTLMLELMNVCENAYRSSSIRTKVLPRPKSRPDSVIYVLTAHPTEARSPDNIWVFQQLQRLCTEILLKPEVEFTSAERMEALHWIRIAWKTPVVRSEKPSVADEAEHVYSTALRPEALEPLLRAGRELAPIYLRSWVGGDKDGHPGVNAAVFRESLGRSRRRLLSFAHSRLHEIGKLPAIQSETLLRAEREVEKWVRRLATVGKGDGRKVAALRRAVKKYREAYQREIGAVHPALEALVRLLQIFPGLVVPLEFRESSDILESRLDGRGLAITGMLRALKSIATGGDPRWYVRGLIVSHTESFSHLKLAARFVKRELRGLRIPVIPLFEDAKALTSAKEIVTNMIQDPELRAARERHWQNYLEVMVGYSDSAKESGVLASRLEIARAMHEIDRLCRAEQVVPLFFQGSGGSVDRGGGSVEEQTAWWPPGALKNYKVTVQGEMIERSFASSEITWRQLERIVASAGRWPEARARKFSQLNAIAPFAARVAKNYREKVSDPGFLALIERATPYPFLNVLKIGSRPSKRASGIELSKLRAIPWVLCWTQTRVLFPTWWGIGSAWKEAGPAERRALRRAYKEEPVFAVFVRALGFTLAKVELAIWSLYLERRAPEVGVEEFVQEEKLARAFYHEISGASNLLQEKRWLLESIELRTPMIHPLNLLQLLALESGDAELLRRTVTGISSGMQATG